MTTNIMRGVLGVVSFYLYNSALVHLQIVEVVTVLWTIPLFVLILSVIFLDEAVSATRWIATAIGFVGLAFITMYDSGVSFSFKLIYLIPAAFTTPFLIFDMLRKTYIKWDSMTNMVRKCQHEESSAYSACKDGIYIYSLPYGNDFIYRYNTKSKETEIILNEKERIGKIYADHRNLIDNLFGNRDYYERRIVDFMMYPKGVVPIGTRIEEVERTVYKLDDEPFASSLDTILSEVIAEQTKVLGKDLNVPSSIGRTRLTGAILPSMMRRLITSRLT